MNIYSINYPIFVLSLKEHWEIKQKLLQMIDEQKSDIINEDGNQKVLTDWQSEIGQERKYFMYLRTYLDKYLLDMFKEIKPEPILEFRYGNVWFHQYYQDYFHSWHNHGCSWAMVYYLELPDPRLGTEFYTPLIKNNVIRFDVKEGDLIFFPGNVFHRGSTNHTNLRKTVIVANIRTQ